MHACLCVLVGVSVASGVVFAFTCKAGVCVILGQDVPVPFDFITCLAAGVYTNDCVLMTSTLMIMNHGLLVRTGGLGFPRGGWTLVNVLFEPSRFSGRLQAPCFAHQSLIVMCLLALAFVCMSHNELVTLVAYICKMSQLLKGLTTYVLALH